jgi:hypothetical protein
MTPARLSSNQIHVLDAELNFSITHHGRGSHDILENKWVSGEKGEVSQKSISFKQKGLA